MNRGAVTKLGAALQDIGVGAHLGYEVTGAVPRATRGVAVLHTPHGTLVVIAHRISSAVRAERILLMDGANPLLGTHEDLLRRSILYAELVGHWSGSRMHAQA